LHPAGVALAYPATPVCTHMDSREQPEEHFFMFGRIFKWAPLGICHAWVEEGGLSPDTMTVRREMPPVN